MSDEEGTASRFTITVPLKHSIIIERLARDNERTIAAEIRVAIRNHIRRETKERV